MPENQTTNGAIAAQTATGISGLDDILGGGFTPNRLYLIEGNVAVHSLLTRNSEKTGAAAQGRFE